MVGTGRVSPAHNTVTQYDSLADLRQAIRSDDRGRFLDAADTVRDAGLSVDDVESKDPPVQDLVDAGIIPEEDNRDPAATVREQILEELRAIRSAVEGGS